MKKENARGTSSGAGYSGTTKATSTMPTVARSPRYSQPEPPARLRYRGTPLDEPARLNASDRRYIRDVAAMHPDRRLYVAPWLFVQRNFAIHVLHAPNWPRMGRGPGYRYRGFARLDIGDELQEKDIVTE